MCQLRNTNSSSFPIVKKISGEELVKAGMISNGLNDAEDEILYFSQEPCTSKAFQPSSSAAANSLTNGGIRTIVNGHVSNSSARSKNNNLPYYLQPDPYDGLIETVRSSMVEKESEVLEAKQLMAELQRKAERFIPNETLNSANLDFVRSTMHSLSSPLQDQYVSKKSLKDATCEICGLGFASVQSKMRHAQRLHPNEMDRISVKYAKSALDHECTICHKAFATIDKLNTHRRRHRPNSRSICEMCGREYPLPSELKKHMKRVHGLLTAENRNDNGSSASASRPSSRSTQDDSEDMPEL